MTRNGYNWADRFPLIFAAVSALAVRSCVIDGEAIVCDTDWLADFDRLRNRAMTLPRCSAPSTSWSWTAGTPPGALGNASARAEFETEIRSRQRQRDRMALLSDSGKQWLVLDPQNRVC